MANSLRLFFALQPPPQAQAELGRLAAWCQRRCGGLAVTPENIHLTLLFLGDITPAQAGAARLAAQNVCWSPFEMSLDRLEYWPGPGLLCAVPNVSPLAAATLATTLRDAVHNVPAASPRPFVSHVTLLRRVRRLQEVSMLPLAWQVSEFCLLRSERRGREVRYSPVDSWSCTSPVPRFSSR